MRRVYTATRRRPDLVGPPRPPPARRGVCDRTKRRQSLVRVGVEKRNPQSERQALVAGMATRLRRSLGISDAGLVHLKGLFHLKSLECKKESEQAEQDALEI
jgi:hypothetical protein